MSVLSKVAFLKLVQNTVDYKIIRSFIYELHLFTYLIHDEWCTSQKQSRPGQG